MLAPGTVFAFGLVAFGFLGMGPVTIAVDSYGPVTDNAQSVYELSLIEQLPDIKSELKRDFGIDADFEHAKRLLEENDGAGNTFKATAKPVLIGTAVVGATTMIFSIIVLLGPEPDDRRGRGAPTTIRARRLHMISANLSILNAPFLLGLIWGAALVYWFSGASCQAVITGAYRAVAFIKTHMHLEEGSTKASIEDSKRVVAICTRYAQAGMFNIFLTVFFATLGAAFVNENFFIGFLISLAITGLYQAIFMANAGGAWDNAKKIVEVELREKGTPLHDATVVGDTVGDPFKDTSSVCWNPIIKFATPIFGLLAVELAISLDPRSSGWCWPWCSWRPCCSLSTAASTGCGSAPMRRAMRSTDPRCRLLMGREPSVAAGRRWRRRWPRQPPNRPARDAAQSWHNAVPPSRFAFCLRAPCGAMCPKMFYMFRFHISRFRI